MGENRFGAGNYDIDILPSSIRTNTTQGTSRDLENIEGAKGVIVTLDWTVEADTVTLTPHIEHKDLNSGKYVILLTAASALTAVGVVTYVVYPGNITARNGVTETADLPLGRVWRVRVAHTDADAATYSVSASYVL